MKTILYIQDTDPAGYPPLERSAHMFAERGWRVHFLGVAAAGAARELAMSPHPNIDVRLLPRGPGGILRPLTYARFLAAGLAAVRRIKPDVVYCSDLRSYPVGLAASRTPSVQTVLHEHDSPPAGTSPLTRALLAVRRSFARRASLCVIPQDARAAAFRAATGAERVVVAYNCPSRAEIGPRTSQRPGGRLTLWYHGSLGPGQFPEAVIGALAVLPEDVDLAFAGYETVSTAGYVDRLQALAANLGVAGRVRYHGRVPLRADLMALASQCHVGLSLFASQFREPMVGASNKPFDYLACGLPLLTNATPEWEGFFGAAGVSKGCDPDSAASIASAVMSMRDNPAIREEMADRGRRLLEAGWNYEAQFGKVMEALGVVREASHYDDIAKQLSLDHSG